MKKESRKLMWALGLVAGVGLLSVAYAALSSTLNISGEGNINTAQGGVQFVNTSKGYKIGLDDPYGYLEIPAGNTNPTEIFESNFAKSIGDKGTLTVESTQKDNDTVSISGIKLYEFNSYILYKLDLKNTAPHAMKLTEIPNLIFLQGEECVDGQIYTDENMSTFLSAYSGSSTSSAANYLPKDGTTSWYLKVSQYTTGSATFNSVKEDFSFIVQPVWEYAG